MDVKKYLEDFKKQFEPRLDKFLKQKEKLAENLAPGFQQAVREIIRLNKAGGKRLRSAFIYTGFKSCCGKDEKLMWSACLAMELIQSFALLHDDIMDNASVRRGQITCFKKLGLNKALLAGDVALILAEQLIPAQAKLYFDLMKWELSAGQWLDIEKALKTPRRWPNGLLRGGGFNEEEVFKIMELKSAMYSIARPLQIGAISAYPELVEGLVGKSIMNAFFNYGKNLGIAFQIQDDILGVFGTEKELGKSVGSDISEGKKTLLIARLLESYPDTSEVKSLDTSEVNASERRSFLNLFGKRKPLTTPQLKLVRKLLKESGSLSYCQEKAKTLVKKAQKAIKNVKIRKKEKEFLMGIADYIITRKK